MQSPVFMSAFSVYSPQSGLGDNLNKTCRWEGGNKGKNKCSERLLEPRKCLILFA